MKTQLCSSKSALPLKALALAGLLGLLASPGGAEPSVCERICQKPQGNVVAVDAAALKIKDGQQLSFPEGTSVTLAIENKNPFAYKYTLKTEAIEVELATIRKALEIIVPGLKVLEEQSTKKAAGLGGECPTKIASEM